MNCSYFKKMAHFLLRMLNQLQTHLLALTFRKKLMIITLLMVGASYYSAPFGIILLSAGLIIEWRKSPERSFSLWHIVRKSVFFIPGVLFLLSAVIGAVYYGHYISAGLALLVLAPILFSATMIEILWQKEDALHFARYATMLVFPLAMIAFIFPQPGGIPFDYSAELRLSSSFSNPNYFSYILEMLLMFSGALYYHVWKKSSRIWLALSVALSILCLYFTGSRTGMLAFFAGAMVFYLCMSEKTILVIVFGTMTLALASVALFPEKAVEIFRDLIPRPESFLSEINNRFMLWDVALKQIAINPVIGTGLDTYRLLIPKNAPVALTSSIHCHNIFINLWLETGILGVLSFLWISLRAGITAIRRLKYSPVRPYLSAGIGMIAIMVVHGLMDAPLVSSQTLAFFVLFLACLVVMNRKTMKF